MTSSNLIPFPRQTAREAVPARERRGVRWLLAALEAVVTAAIGVCIAIFTLVLLAGVC